MNNKIAALVIVTTSLLLISEVYEAREIKPAYAMTICGDDFLKIYKKLCAIKNKRQRKSLAPQHGLNSVKKTFLGTREAQQFLHPLHRRRRQVTSQDDATEECCLEKCTLGEIAEYSC